MEKMAKPPEIGKSIKAARIEKNITLSDLSEMSGVSKGMLSQIENGTANPTIATAWKITSALGFTLNELFTPEKSAEEFLILKKGEAFVFEEDDNKWKVFVLSPPRMAEVLELYWIDLQPGAEIKSDSHVTGALEFATVIAGEVEVSASSHVRKISVGDSAQYKADVSHCIKNTGTEPASIYLVVKFE